MAPSLGWRSARRPPPPHARPPRSRDTDLDELTSHEFRLAPALYWLPMVRRAVDTNNARVLRQIRRQAEQSARPGGRDGRSVEGSGPERNRRGTQPRADRIEHQPVRA